MAATYAMISLLEAQEIFQLPASVLSHAARERLYL